MLLWLFQQELLPPERADDPDHRLGHIIERRQRLSFCSLEDCIVRTFGSHVSGSVSNLPFHSPPNILTRVRSEWLPSRSNLRYLSALLTLLLSRPPPLWCSGVLLSDIGLAFSLLLLESLSLMMSYWRQKRAITAAGSDARDGYSVTRRQLSLTHERFPSERVDNRSLLPEVGEWVGGC